MVGGEQLRELRRRRSWTQAQAAKQLGVSQAFWSMLERGRRPPPPALVPALVRQFRLPATALPLPEQSSGSWTDQKLASSLARLGYPGFQHLCTTGASQHNPAEVLAAALQRSSLDARVTEALPWLAAEYSEMDWNWLVRETKLRDRQNRLGYLVELACQLLDRSRRMDALQRLSRVKLHLDASRLVQEDSFAGSRLSAAESRWLRARRPPEAEHWNLLTDLTVDQLPYGQ